MEALVLIIWFVCALAGALIMQHVKGRSALLGGLLGAFLGLIGLIIILCIPKKEPADTYACPACGEQVKLVAKVCKHCHTPLS